jgi:murein DD-endopeptidase MepM/ murein hydrolase activator NlpD
MNQMININRDRTRRTETHSQNKKVNIKGDFDKIVLYQVSVCLIAILIAVILRLSNSETFISARTRYFALTSPNLSPRLIFSQVVHYSERIPVAGKYITKSKVKIKSVLSPKKTAVKNTSNTENESKAIDNALEVMAYVKTDLNKLLKNSSLNEAEFTKALVFPVDGTYTSLYGIRVNPITKLDEFHKGIDISAKENAYVYAAADGVIKTAQNSSSYGNYIIINHDGKTQTLYAHMNSLLVSVKDKVRKGEAIGKAGSTGQSDGVHLHFEVLNNGISYNPKEALDCSKTISDIMW